MQRKRRHPKNPTRRLTSVARDVNRSFPDWEAVLVEAYAPTGSERVLFFRVKDRLSGRTVFQTTSTSDRCVGAERWLRKAKGQLATR
jgi:hypothetical protein